MRSSYRFGLLACLAALLIHADGTFAQSYPTKSIHIVVPFASGGPLDTMARLIGKSMSDALKQAVIVENRPGADGNIGTNHVAKAAPDGHTILVGTSILAASPALYRNLPFNAAADFAPVSQLIGFRILLVSSLKTPASSTKEFIALAKSRPGALNYGHTGVGSQAHLVMELLKLSTGIEIQAIPYKGAPAMQLALTTGEVDAVFATMSSGVEWAKSGRARALGVASAQRSPVLPDVPTIAEAGVAGFEAEGWFGLFVPTKTPRHSIRSIREVAAKALQVPEVKTRLEALGNEIVGSTPEEFDAKFKADIAKYSRVIREARIPTQD